MPSTIVSRTLAAAALSLALAPLPAAARTSR